MKRNVSISLPEDTYRRARMWAAKRDTTVTAVVRYLIENLPGFPIARKGFPIPAELDRSASARRAPSIPAMPATPPPSAPADSPAQVEDPPSAR